MNKSSKRSRNELFGKPKNAEEAKLRQLLFSGDRAGYRYLQASQLKRKRKLSQGEQRFLKEFDTDRRRIARDPKSVWANAMGRVYRELLLVECLIHENRENGISEENNEAAYNAMMFLMMLAMEVRGTIIRHAENGSELACHSILIEGDAMASAFARLAILQPALFRRYTERSLTMPSLRARNPGFTCDAEAIMEAVHLAEKHHASNIHDNRTRIGALCHAFVARIVDLVARARLEARAKGDLKSEWFQLPELKGNVKVWWEAEVKAWVHREFERMKKNPRHNPALWQELEKLTDSGTDSARRAALEKYCLNKLEQIARWSPLTKQKP